MESEGEHDPIKRILQNAKEEYNATGEKTFDEEMGRRMAKDLATQEDRIAQLIEKAPKFGKLGSHDFIVHARHLKGGTASPPRFNYV